MSELAVTTVTITPRDNTVIEVFEGETKTITCITGPSRPPARIQWYIGVQNVTNLAQTNFTNQDDKFISSSTLVYTGNDTNHEKNIFCTAVNIEGRQEVKSEKMSIYIHVPVTKVTITSTDNHTEIGVVEGDQLTFTCTTGPSRPPVRIQWYIGVQNVTNLAQTNFTNQDDKFISSSTLVYTGNDTNHEQNIFCTAVNIEGRQDVESEKMSIYIHVPVAAVTITPAGDNNIIEVVEGAIQNFTCTTAASRPYAYIQWYIGGENVTIKAQPESPVQNGSKFISSSSLEYVGKGSDHINVIYCEAYNIFGRDKVKTTQKSIFILIGPKTVTLVPVNDSYTVNETKSLSEIKCSATCRPDCNYTWIGPTGFTNYQPKLQFDSIYRNQSGIYHCTANNDFGSKTSNKIIITVHYPPDVSINHIFTDEDESEVSFVCNASGIPSTYFYSGWTQTFDGHDIRNSSALSSFTYDDNKTLTLSRLFYQDAGNYTCYVDNGVPDRIDQVLQFGQEQLNVKGWASLRSDIEFNYLIID
ncbi:nephrin-like [Mytilus edulis]|uniref:nephrin-like n=1 Tax=Mytilus edulis TaxID=6550 RepID=UPI0039F0A2AC